MKKIIATLIVTATIATAGEPLFTLRDRQTQETISDIHYRLQHDPHMAPGWTLGSKPFGTINGGWEVVPVLPAGKIVLKLN